MATGSSDREKEGDKFIAEGHSCMKTSWLKWRPDIDGAARAYEKAGLCYRNAKAYKKAEEAYYRASEAYHGNHAAFQSGRCLEQAAHMCRERKDLDTAAEYLEKASSRYHEDGKGDSAGQALTKAAKLVEASNPRMAAKYHLATAELHKIEQKDRDATVAMRSAVNMWARAEEYEVPMLDTVRRLRSLLEEGQQYQRLHELAAIEVLCHLHNGDGVAASDAYNAACTVAGFVESDEAPVVEELITGFREGDREAVDRCCDSVVFKCMDNNIALMARVLKRKADFALLSEATVTSQTQRPSSSPEEPHSGVEQFGGGEMAVGGEEEGEEVRSKFTGDLERLEGEEFEEKNQFGGLLT